MIMLTALVLASTLGAAETVFSDEFDLSPDGCPASSRRLGFSDIRYPNSGNSLRYDADLTRYENIWGHATYNDPVVPWPGGNGYTPVMLDFGKYQYVASGFHVPSDFPIGVYGNFVYSTYYSGPEVTLAYSQTCGDFNPATAHCVSAAGSGESFKKWVIAPHVNGCMLTPGMDYFINIKMTDPQAEDCAGQSTCKIGFSSILGSQ